MTSQITLSVAIGRRIRYARQAAKMSQTDLAAKLGVERAAVSFWENGTRAPKYETLIKLCRVLATALNEDINPNRLLGWRG